MTQRDKKHEMEDTAAEVHVVDGVVLAEGVDEEPVESNRRMFTGRSYVVIATLAAIYAAFHMFALNGVSIADLTGTKLPFLPQFPMETWNFRTVHIAGALVLGFLLFSAHGFTKDAEPPRETRSVSLVAALLAIPALLAGATAIGFILFLQSGGTIEMMGRPAWISLPGEVPEAFAAYEGIYRQELYWFGIPLLIATFGAIVTGWIERRDRSLFAVS
ncbi:MAG: TRAP transporter permease, partial [Paracoccaceae bacterium]